MKGLPKATTIVATITASLALCAFADEGEFATHHKRKTYLLYDGIRLASEVTTDFDRPSIVIKSVYPQLKSDNEEETIDPFNQLVVDMVKQQKIEFKKQVDDNQVSIKALAKTITKKSSKNDLYLDYNTSYIQAGTQPILSIRFSIQGYIDGMAHPYHQHQVLNYDLKNDKKLELNDLFAPDAPYLQILSLYCEQILSKRLPESTMIHDGTSPTADHYKIWNIKPGGLLITFEEATVAPYVYGAQTVYVPFTVLQDWVNKESPIAICLKHKRKCQSNHVLTGGFIDTAINSQHRRLNPRFSQL